MKMKSKYIILLTLIIFLVHNNMLYVSASNNTSYNVGEKLDLGFTGNMQTVNISRSGTYNIKLNGAQGANSTYSGGYGGYVEVSVNLIRGDVLYLNIGGQNGYNGGGNGYNAGNGGGGTVLYLNSTSNNIAIAGGGGGGSTVTSGGAGGIGGGGGTNQGSNGNSTYITSAGGGGGYVGGTSSSYLTHVHTGSNKNGGGCYTNAVYHTHDSGCYSVTGKCTTTVVNAWNPQTVGKVTCTWHGSVSNLQWDIIESHSSCGNGDTQTRRNKSACDHPWTASSHDIKSLTCVLPDVTYDLNCGKTLSTIDVNINSNGGTNYYNSTKSVLVSSLSGKQTGNGNASITLTKADFTINTQPQNTSTFDGADATFMCQSAQASETGYYVWQTLIDGEYKNIGSISFKEKNNNKNNTFYNTKYEYGINANGMSYLTIKEATKSKNDEAKIRCIVYEFEGLSYNLTSNVATLSVLTSSITSMQASYISETIEVNKIIRIEDIFAICGYQSGKSQVVRNFDGLKIVSFETPDNNFIHNFEDNGASSFPAYKTGIFKVNLKYENEITNLNGSKEKLTFNMSFNVNVVDTTPPNIISIDSKKNIYGDYYIPGNDFDLQIRALVEIEDNYCETDVYEYDNKTLIDTGECLYEFYRQDQETKEWNMLTDSFRKGNYFDILYTYGNGNYKVIAKDKEGNISKPFEFIVIGWDNTSPIINIISSSDSVEYCKYAEIMVTANDGSFSKNNIGQLHEEAYYIEKIDNDTTLISDPNEIFGWTNENVFNVTKNGTYRIYVRDNYGNMSYENKRITNIDTISPTVAYTITSCQDGQKVLITIKAIDNNADDANSAISGLNKDCFSYSENVVLSEPVIEGDYVRTYFYANLSETDNNYFFNTVDKVGNYTRNAVTKEEILTVIRDGTENEYSIIESFTCTNTDYKTQYPEWTSNGVIITPEVKTGTDLPSGAYSWDYIGYGTNEGYWDKTNGTWSSNPNLTVYENGTYTVYVKLKDDYINKKSIIIGNIDNKNPSITATQNDTILTVSVTDDDSGIEKIIVDGGSLSNIYEFKYTGENSIKEMIEISQNGVYNIYAFDMAGNKSEVYSKTVSSITETVKNNYMVNFLTYTDAILSCQYIEEGADATPPTNVKRNGYTFVGWDKSFVNIQENTNINAVFVEDEKKDIDTNNNEKTKYTVTFCNWDGSVLKSQTIEEGGNGTPPSAPTKEGEVFTGWDQSYSNVRADISTKALFTKKKESEDTKDDNNKKNTGTGSTTKNEDIMDEEEEIIEESYIELTEFADEASNLSVSAFDTSSKENTDDEEFINNILKEDVENAETTENVEINAKRIGVKQIMSIIALIAMGAGIVFYILNKKFYWIDLPF